VIRRADVAVVGAGIAGLANAYTIASRGRRVVVFERNSQARGASVRNFGMIWPTGQPPGRQLETALRSREIWLEVLKAAGIPYSPAGSLHAVYRSDEATVACEFAGLASRFGYQCRWLQPDQALTLAPIRAEGLIGGLFSTTELTIDPRAAIATLPPFLVERYGVVFRFNAPVREIELPNVQAGNETWQVDRAVVCTGDDFDSLYPDAFAQSGLIRVKLQMMRTHPQPPDWRLGPALAAGLTLRFYNSFRVCPSLEQLRLRIQEELPAYERWGIHVMASQNHDGEVTIGDSHEYGLTVDVWDKPQVDELILDYLRTFLVLPDPRIQHRWHGVYSKHFTLPWFDAEPAAGVRVITGLGGAGMTLSFGLADAIAKELK
jgi:FAD dependent oxidoreductase TIGR03364